MVQDIVVHISLDTKATPRESLIPLILSLDGAKSYKEYATLDALLADYAATTAAGKAAKALYANAEEMGNAPEIVAVLGLASSSTNQNITDALDTLRDNHDDWYYLLPAAATDTQITALAAWAAGTVLSLQTLATGQKEAEKLLVAQSATKSIAITSAQSVICYNADVTNSYMHAAWVGRMIGYYPEAVTWKWKGLVGIPTADVDAAALGTLLTNHVNTYVNNHKREYMRDGVCADGEYIDVVIGRWQIKQAMRAAITKLMVETDEVPYNDTGFAMIGAAIISALNSAATNGIIRSIDNRPQYKVVIPRYSDASEKQIEQRIMPDITWYATLRGGVHGIKATGTLSIKLASEEE